jgi:TPP-dependent pyruvate/acetoin dehydrogenase alpha subunit
MIESIYRSLYRIRRVEEEIARVYPTDKIKSPVHLSIGQEAISVAVCENLRPEDIIFCSYRSHAAYLAKGGDLQAMIAELYGKATGVAKGKGGSMHLIDAPHGVMGASAVVGTTIPQAVGFAYAVKLQREDVVVVSFFGDGATDEGVFYESLNFAALKQLPVIFICENNSYAIHTHQLRRQPQANICERVRAHSVPAERIEDDVLKVHERVGEAVRALRAGRPGPFFFECLTYRWKEHVGPNEDYHLGYRTKEEADPWIKNDQVKRVAGMIEDARREGIQQEVEAEIQTAFDFAETSPVPEGTELYADVFKGA